MEKIKKSNLQNTERFSVSFGRPCPQLKISASSWRSALVLEELEGGFAEWLEEEPGDATGGQEFDLDEELEGLFDDWFCDNFPEE